MTKSIKLVLVGSDFCYGEDYYANHVIKLGLTDWEEVSDEDYDLILKNKNRIKHSFPDFKVGIVVKDQLPVTTTVAQIKDDIEKENQEILRKLREEQQKKDEKARKTAESKIEKAKKQIEKLQSLVNSNNK